MRLEEIVVAQMLRSEGEKIDRQIMEGGPFRQEFLDAWGDALLAGANEKLPRPLTIAGRWRAVHEGNAKPPYPYGIQQKGGVRKIPSLRVIRDRQSDETASQSLSRLKYELRHKGQDFLAAYLAARYRLPERWEWC